MIGNKKVIDALKNISKRKNIPHIMVSGDIGTGKSLLKKIFIESLNIHEKNILHINLNEDLKKNNMKNNQLFNFLKKPIKN